MGKTKVLITVEDNTIVALQIKIIPATFAFDATARIASSGTTALSKIKEAFPDLTSTVVSPGRYHEGTSHS